MRDLDEEIRLFFGPEVEDRIAANSHLHGECLLWTGCVSTYGYGVIGVDGKSERVHRVAYCIETGDWPEALHHLCGVKTCINVAHLEPVTHSEHRRLHSDVARKPRRTYCKYGHAMDAGDTRIYFYEKNGREMWFCRRCERVARKARHHGTKPTAEMLREWVTDT